MMILHEFAPQVVSFLHISRLKFCVHVSYHHHPYYMRFQYDPPRLYRSALTLTRFSVQIMKLFKFLQPSLHSPLVINILLKMILSYTLSYVLFL